MQCRYSNSSAYSHSACVQCRYSHSSAYTYLHLSTLTYLHSLIRGAAAVNYGMTTDAKCKKAEEASKAKQAKGGLQMSAEPGRP